MKVRRHGEARRARRRQTRWMRAFAIGAGTALAVGLSSPAHAVTYTFSPDGWSKGSFDGSYVGALRVKDGGGACHWTSSYVLTATGGRFEQYACNNSYLYGYDPSPTTWKICTNRAGEADSCSGYIYQ